MSAHAPWSLNLALILSAALFGSGDRPTRFDLELKFAESILDKDSVVVDVIAVTEKDYADNLEQIEVSDYFSLNNPLRATFTTWWLGRPIKKTPDNPSNNRFLVSATSFVQGHRTRSRTYAVSDYRAMWDKWFDAGKTHLVVLADLPAVVPDQEGTLDHRRVLIPLNRKAWASGTKRIIIEIHSARVEFYRGTTPVETNKQREVREERERQEAKRKQEEEDRKRRAAERKAQESEE